MTSIGLLLCDDLLFISRVTGTARALGLEIMSVRGAAELFVQAKLRPPACVLIDIQNPGLDIVALVGHLKSAGKAYLVGYGSHIDTATLKAARDAGCDLVLPRSKFVAELDTELPRWMGNTTV